MTKILLILVSTILVNNFVLAKFLGICPFLGVSRKTETAVGMGLAVTFVVTLSTALTWLMQMLILKPFHIEYMQTIVFILVIAGLVQFVEMVLQKTSPALYQALGIYLPLITTNCMVLGVAVLAVQLEYSFIESLIYSFGASVGFALALVLFAGIRERLSLADVPEALQGTAIGLVTTGLLALAFMGFNGLVK
ncbi:MAG: electron transport complex subunit RsxA [bacterium]|nr:electron transport complex subunit RsxA [bacterium]